MNTIFNWQKCKSVFLVSGLCTLLLATSGKAAAAATIEIKDTNYKIPTGAYFVSPDGQDTNTGKTATSPWSVTKAIASAPSGATIVFRGGTYRNISLKIKKKVTLQAYPGEQAWLKGSVVVTGWAADGSLWVKNGWTYSFPQNVRSEFIDPAYPIADYRDMVYVDGVALQQVASKAEVAPGTFYVDSANNRLYIGDNPAGKTVESTALPYAFTLWKKGSDDESDSKIRGLGFAHYADMGVRIGAPRVTLENNTFAWNGVTGAHFWGNLGGEESISRDAIVRGNTFSYNGRKGLGGDQVDRMLLEDNTFSYNNVEHYAEDWDAAGIKVTGTDGLIWRKNLVEHNFSTGMWMDLSVTNATVINNRVRYNDGIGIFFEVSHKAIIAGNLAYNNGYAGIMLSNSSSGQIYNNTLADNKVNIRIKDTNRNNTNKQEIKAGVTWIARNNVIKNNILSSTTGDSLVEASNCATDEQSKLMIDAADYNGYYRSSSSQPKTAFTWGFNAKQCAVTYTSIAAFNSATGYEANAVTIDNVKTNPFFVDVANENYGLKAGSPAIRRGVALPADIAQVLGVATGVKVDLGAFQSQTVLSTGP